MNQAAPTYQPWDGSQWPPRDWQAKALPVIIAAIKRGVRGIVSATMGSGKSVLMAELAWVAMAKLGERCVVVVAPREKLIRQLSGTFAARCGENNVGQYYGKKKQPNRRIIVCCGASLPSLRLKLAETGRKVALMIVDEAHSSEAATLKETIPLLAPVALVGFTATPFRSAPSETVSLFTEIIYSYTMEDALRDGVLVPLRHVRYEGVAKPGTVDAVTLQMIEEHSEGPGIVSATSIKDAEAYAVYLTDHGHPAQAIHSKLKESERESRLARLEAGELRALVHVSLLAEGVDLPWLRWIALRRKVKASVRFWQEVGRVGRIHPGKTEGLVLDPHLLMGVHGTVNGEVNLGAAMDEAIKEAEEETPEAKERKEQEKQEQEVIALDLLLEYLEDLRWHLVNTDLMKTSGHQRGRWQDLPITPGQAEMIKNVKKNTRYIPRSHRGPIKALATIPYALTAGQASALLDVLKAGAGYCHWLARRDGVKPWKVTWEVGRVERLAVPDAAQIKLVSKIKEKR